MLDGVSLIMVVFVWCRGRAGLVLRLYTYARGLLKLNSRRVVVNLAEILWDL